MSLPNAFRSAINAAAGLFGARVVNSQWGPRGVQDTLRRARDRGFRPACVFDIGASNGQWTMECRNYFATARYVLVDPLDVNKTALSDLAKRDARVTAFFGVAGPEAGRLQLHDHGDQSSILTSEDFPGVPRTVEATTVDALFDAQGQPAPVLLKADVQGYELEVLKGAKRCLESTEMLILEVSFRELYKHCALAHEVVAYVGERGFRIFDICSYLQRPTDHDLIQSDIVFVHESSALYGRHGWT